MPVLRTATEVEAHCLGVFIGEVFRQLMVWRRDEKVRRAARFQHRATRWWGCSGSGVED